MEAVSHSRPSEPLATDVAGAARLIAIHLPQFHPIPENNAWWGQGFTEWTNVAKARPQFPGHDQPHLPADLGFYDLRLPEARAAQAELAREYGIHGFCYYHYWFHGRRLLERPVDEILASGEPDFPFCLAWANEPWSRRWDGMAHDVLMPQSYSAEDDHLHGRWLARAFADPRYIRVGDRPLFLLYRTSLLPEPRRTTDIWRDEARRAGVGDPWLVRVEAFEDDKETDPRPLGFDASVEFMPDGRVVGPRLRKPIRRGWRRRLLGPGPDEAEALCMENHNMFDYGQMVANAMARPDPPYPRFRCVTPGWDNTARRTSGATIMRGNDPVVYERWLASAIDRAQAAPEDQRFVFINAWNEWAEGNHLEPCQRWGRAFLEATRRARLASASAAGPGGTRQES
jgi:lipopolysaccharide biosynthesis protein